MASSSTTTTTFKRYTRDQIMAMARYEYARQLSIYTRAQLTKGQALQSRSSSTTTAATTTSSTANTRRMVC
jgi:hypothetical protein